jgi:hypothetical protein
MGFVMKRLISAWLVLLVAGHGRAADTPTAAQIAACAPDARRFCLQHFNDHEALRACMIEHKRQLSEACKAAFR